jgi:chromate transporter
MAQTPPTLREALAFWLKLGCISFGGPAGQIAIMHRELVETRRWISEQRFLHALNYCMLLPGPEAQQLATYLGWLLHGTRGGLIAGGFFILPSLVILIALSYLYLRFSQTPVLQAALYGIKPAVAALVFVAAWRLGRRTLHHFSLIGVAALATAALALTSIPFPLMVVLAALTGWAVSRYRPNWLKRPASAHAPVASTQGTALIDDNTPTPEHALVNVRRLVGIAAIGIALALGGAALIAQLPGRDTYLDIAQFFTQAALVTFGGAYAVLPYVFEAAVQDFRWLTVAQMMDGLALGESTPGPLIMVVAFIGYLAAAQQALLGSDGVFLAGALGAMIATFYTFLPSFMFILLGGPFVEKTRDSLTLAGPLTFISAAVVGVILYLGLVFGYHVVRPAAGAIDYFASGLTIIAIIALARFQINTIMVIAACCVIGAVYALV